MNALPRLGIHQRHVALSRRSRVMVSGSVYAHPRRINHQRQLQRCKPNRVPVVLPAEFGWDDHIVCHLERRRVTVGEVVQGEEDGNVQPFSELLDCTRDRLAAVGPDDVRAVLRQESLAAGKEGRDFLVVDPAAAGRGRVEQRHGDLFVSRESHPRPVWPDPRIVDLVAHASPGEEFFHADLFPGIHVRAAKGLAREARPRQHRQAVQGGRRRPIREIQNTVRRDERHCPPFGVREFITALALPRRGFSCG